MATPPFTLVLRDGETVVENHHVTDANQRLFVVTDSCAGLASRGVPDPIGPGFFNPPLGWWVVEIRQADGGEDQIWAAPDGSVAIRHGACLGVATGAGEGVGTKLKTLPLTTSTPAPAAPAGTPTPPSTPASVPTWLLLLGGAGALGYVAYRWMKPKETGAAMARTKKTKRSRGRSRKNPDMDKLLLVGAAGIGAYLLYRYFSGTTEAAIDAQAKTVMPLSSKLIEPGRAMLPVGHVQCIATYLARKQGVASVKVQQLVDGGYVVYGTALPPRSDAGQRVLLKQGALSEIHDWIYQTWQPDDETPLKSECPAAMASLL